MSYCCLFGTFSVYPTSQSARDDTTALQGEGHRAAGVTALEAWFTFDGEKKRNDAVPSSSAPPRTPPRQLVHDHDGNAATSSSDVGRIILTGSLDVPHIVTFRRRWVHAQVPSDVRVDIAQVPSSPFSDDAEDSLSKKQKQDAAAAVPPSQSWWNASFTIHGDDVEKALTSLTVSSAPSDTMPSLERRERAVSMLSRSFALPSICGGASAALRGVVHVFLVVCSPPTTAMSSDSITPSSRSPSTTSHSGLSSECAAGGGGVPFARVGSFHNAGGTPTSTSACRGGRISVGIHVTPTQEFLDVLVPQILSMHLKYAHRSVYHDALDIMEKQFEAAVEELVGLESTYHREIEMRDEIIASLQLQVQRQHESEPSTMMTAEHTNDTGVMSHTPKKNSDALSSDGAALEQQQPTTIVTSPLKQKDMEIFLLRARVGAIETAKKLELDELRRELETLRSKHQLTIRKNVERAVSAQRKKPRHGQQHPQQQQRSSSDRDEKSDAPVGSSHKSALVCRSTETTERKKSSSSSRSGSKSRPLSEERHHRKDAWEPQPHTGGGGYSARTTDQSNSAQTFSTAPRREANETAVTAAEERSNRLRRLEESFAKLQSRQAAHLGNIQQHRDASNTPLVSEEGETADQARRKVQDDGPGLPKHRQASPLRIPAVVPGLKLTSEQLQKVAPSGSGGSASAGGGDPEVVLVPSSASALSRQSTATTGRQHQQQPSPRVSSVSRNAPSSPSPSSSLLRQSPLRLFEQQNHMLHRSGPSSKGLPSH